MSELAGFSGSTALTMLTVFSFIVESSSRNVTQTHNESCWSILSITFLPRKTASLRVVELKISFMMMMLFEVAWARIW